MIFVLRGPNVLSLVSVKMFTVCFFIVYVVHINILKNLMLFCYHRILKFFDRFTLIHIRNCKPCVCQKGPAPRGGSRGGAKGAMAPPPPWRGGCQGGGGGAPGGGGGRRQGEVYDPYKNDP